VKNDDHDDDENVKIFMRNSKLIFGTIKKHINVDQRLSLLDGGVMTHFYIYLFLFLNKKQKIKEISVFPFIIMYETIHSTSFFKMFFCTHSLSLLFFIFIWCTYVLFFLLKTVFICK